MSEELLSISTKAQDDQIALGRCVFIPPGSGPRVVFGQDGQGGLIHIEDAERGKACGLICPDCGGDLVANKGEIKQPYFSHASRLECRHAGETALHKMAKDIIYESGQLSLPDVTVDHYGEKQRFEVIRRARKISFSRVEVEIRQDGFQPDLIGIFETDANGHTIEHRLHIEICVTHAVDADKLALLRKNGESVLEIDLSKVRRSITRSELSSLLLGKAPRQWLYHRVAHKKQEEIDKKRNRAFEKRLRDQQRKKAYAELKRQEREDELNWPPAGADASWVEHAARRKAYWCQLGYEWLYHLPADDRYFDVEPEVWRTQVIDAISPSNKHADSWAKVAAKEREHGVPSREGMAIATKLSAWMRARSFAKAPYAKDRLIDYVKGIGKMHRFPIADQVECILSGIANKQDSMSRSKRSFRLDEWWADVEATQSRLDRFLSEVEGTVLHLRERDVVLMYKGQLISDRKDMQAAFADEAEGSVVWNREWWRKGGEAMAGIPLFCQVLENHHREDWIASIPYDQIRCWGFTIRINCDTDVRAEQRALRRLSMPYFG